MGDPDRLEVEAASGNRDAFARLMTATKGRLHRFILGYVGNPEEAYDLLQDSYTSAWLAISKYDPKRPFEAWLRTIALNKCRDWSRRRRVRHWLLGAASLDSPKAVNVSDGKISAEDWLQLGQSIEILRAAIVDLPDGLKAPLILTLIEERSQAEAAAILNLSVKAVETRVARARRHLKERLGPDVE